MAPRIAVTKLRWPAWLRVLGAEGDLPRLVSLMALFFLVVCAVGILRPVKNALALEGLGATDFYKTYLVSAAVVLFVPLFNRLSRHLSARVLFAAIAWFFAANLLLLRLSYREGSAAFGLVFYGWYDLFAAALVTQFFMATQLYFDARSAKRAYPIVIAGGSVGATLGGGITWFFAESLGTPNLLLVAAAIIAVFALGIPWVIGKQPSAAAARTQGPGGAPGAAGGTTWFSTLRELAGDRQVRLIAGAVLLTIIVKQLVDYQFNAITMDVFQTRDAVAAFQGKFNTYTQWLPLVVLAGLRPALRRWGIAAAVLLLPFATLATTAALALSFGLWAAVAAKGADASMRYSAERAGRELMYVPVRPEIKLKAKAYIDVAVEKGVGKISSAVLIMALLTVVDRRGIAFFTAGLALIWLVVALGLRREYTRTLARSIENRFASFRGTFASLVDASTLPIIRRALAEGAPVRIAFALELLAQADERDLRELAPELNRLVGHEQDEIRATALVQLARIPDLADAHRVRERVRDRAEPVRDAAVQVLMAASGERAPALCNELLHDDAGAVRTAALRCLVGKAATPGVRAVGRAYVEERWSTAAAGDAAVRTELALAVGGMHGDAEAGRFLAPFLDDADPRVRGTALRSAALLGRIDCCGRMIAALRDPATRAAARDSLALIGEPAVAPLAAALLDTDTPEHLRRLIPSTLARIPAQQTVDAMLRLVLAPQTDQLLDFRTLKALGKLRSRHPDLQFDPALVWQVAERESDHAQRYAAVRAALAGAGSGDGVGRLLASALEDGERERREGVFRCLGLLYPPEPVLRAFLAATGGKAAARANALEWIEQTVGSTRARRIAAAIEPDAAERPKLSPRQLVDDGDAWIAHLARSFTCPTETGMELIEKVFLLRQVDLLSGARGAHVALLASIADEIEAPPDTVLLPAGEPPAALYVVARGSVELHGVGERLVVGPDGAFGTWALIDDQPSLLEARTLEPTRLLRVTRADFHDLLDDHGELALGLLQGLAHRVRSLVS